MSIEDDQKAIIRLGTVHSWIFKASLYVMPIFGLWAVKTIVQHDTDIAVIKAELAMMSGGKFGNTPSLDPRKVAAVHATDDECSDQK